MIPDAIRGCAAAVLLATTGPASPAQAGGGSNGPERELVVRQAFLAAPKTAHHHLQWVAASVLGDVDRDGRHEFYFQTASGVQPGYQPDDVYEYWYFPHQSDPEPEVLRWGWPQPFALTSGFAPANVVLGKPTGATWMAYRSSISELMAWDVSSRVFLGDIPFGIGGIFWAGDVNGDGWDDAFCHLVNGNAVAGMIDGRTLSPGWVEVRDPDVHTPCPAIWTGAGVRPDINGDGIPDFIDAHSLYTPGAPFYEHVYRAFSGRDGAELWSLRDSLQGTSWSRYSSWGPDLNLDGFPDIVSVSLDFLLGVDAASGTLLYQGTKKIMDDVFPPSVYDYALTHPISVTGALGDPGGQEIFCVVEAAKTSWPYPREWRLVYLDPITMQRMDYVLFPGDLLPWSSDLIEDPNFINPMRNWSRFLGDIDRDGFVEIARVSNAYHLPGAYPSTNISILGQRTLFIPESAQIGTNVDLHVSIPSSPGREFHTLVSTEFDGNGGVVLDGGWPTFLAPSFSLTMSLGGQFHRGLLDASGEASLSISIPNNPGLRGKTIYSRVVIEELSEPGGVWTLSSLGVTEVL